MVINEWALTSAAQSDKSVSQENKHTSEASEGMQQESELQVLIMWEFLYMDMLSCSKAWTWCPQWWFSFSREFQYMYDFAG